LNKYDKRSAKVNPPHKQLTREEAQLRKDTSVSGEENLTQCFLCIM
jgi:hypothetical protein